MVSINDLFKKNSNLYGPTSGYGISPTVPMRTQTLPNDAGTYQTPSGQKPSLSSVYNGPVSTTIPSMVSAPVVKKTVPVVRNPVSQNTGSSPIPSQWINPQTGGFYTPEEVAANIAKTAPVTSTNGDIPKYAGDVLTQGPQSTEQLQGTASNLNNSRNDLAVGATDPYKIASSSGIAYTPTELAAIEKAYAGIYDPAINSALSKLDQKQKEDAAALENKNKLEQMAQEHIYDLELKRTPSGDKISTGTSGDSSSTGYIVGKNSLVDDYVNRINSGQMTEADLIKYLPGVKNTDTRNKVMQGLNATRLQSSGTASNLDTVNTINDMLKNKSLENISGGVQGRFGLGGLFGDAKTAKTQYDQILGALQLAKAGSIKGQGQVSDFERTVLKEAAAAIDRGMSDEAFRQSLIKLRGVMLTSSGLEAPVRITDPSTGESDMQILNRNEISKFISDGARIEFVE